MLRRSGNRLAFEALRRPKVAGEPLEGSAVPDDIREGVRMEYPPAAERSYMDFEASRRRLDGVLLRGVSSDINEEEEAMRGNSTEVVLGLQYQKRCEYK